MKTRERIRPLLVIDGDSLAHRAYHGLPKTIVLGDGRGAGAIIGFANFLLRLYESEQPRAVLSDGILSTLRPIGKKPGQSIRVGGISMIPCSSNWPYCQSS